LAPSGLIDRGELLAVAAALDQAAQRGCAALAQRLTAAGRKEEADQLRRLTTPFGESTMSGAERTSNAAPSAAERERQAQILASMHWREPELPSSATLYRGLAWVTTLAGQRFKLFSALAGLAGDEPARALAEKLAQEELSKAAALRPARRRAYRAERRLSQSDPLAAARAVGSLDELRAAARQIEGRLASLLAVMAEAEPAAASALAITRDVLQTLNGAVPQRAKPAKPHGFPVLVVALDDAFAFYDLVQSRAANEAVMELAQELAQRTLERLQIVRTG